MFNDPRGEQVATPAHRRAGDEMTTCERIPFTTPPPNPPAPPSPQTPPHTDTSASMRNDKPAALLTWNSVDGFEWPQHPHRPDGRQVDVLQVEGIFHHPVQRKQRDCYSFCVENYNTH